MTKEIPLSLQVFHSRNEYDAQRLNRTEQIRLRDLHEVIKREEKLYVKNYAIFKQRFHSNHVLRRSDTGITSLNILNSRVSTSRNCTRPASVSSRISVFSAPGKLQTTRANSVDHSLASKLCNSFGEITTLTRFQRVQRKFSLASFTENGLLTKHGSQMSKNIDKAREILFKESKGCEELPKIMKGISPNRLQPTALSNNDHRNGIDGRTERHPDENNTVESNDDGGRELLKPEVGNDSVPHDSLETNPFDNKSKCRENMPSLGSIVEESPHSQTKTRQNFPTATDITTNSNSNSSQNTVKKKVTIRSHLDGNEGDENDEKLHEEDNLASRDFSDCKSVFSKSIKRIDPLQQKIKAFLADQKDFNKIFPKQFDGVTETSDVQKELASIGSDKREQESRDRKKKNGIVMEVLNKLGIEDENILCLYKD